MVIVVGTMPSSSLASLVNLGTLNATSFTNYFSKPVSSSYYSRVRRVSLSKRNFSRKCKCRYSVAPTDFVAEANNASSFSYQDSDAEIVLKPAPKPVLKSEGAKNGKGLSWNGELSEGGDKEENERSKMIESLGEVLEKAEKLETSNVNVNIDVNKAKTSGNGGGSGSSGKKTKTLKSVWRKGDSVGTVPKVVKESSKVNSNDNKEGESQGGSGAAPLRPPQPPLRPQPKLQSKPSVAPPPVVKKPVILKDVGAGRKPESDPDRNSRERKPILIDKFASKKPVIAQAVLAPTKPAKGPAPGKFKDDYRKKNISPGGYRRRIISHDDLEIPDEETSELNVSIPGAATTRKGRKWSKASRKAARIQAAKEAAPVKVEILEVGEKGMSVEELAYNLAIGEGEILGSLYSKGIKPDGVQTLDKDIVKMLCKEYEVEVIDADPVKVEDKAKKKKVLDEDDLDKLQDRPPVLTIMGHVDHGKTTLLDFIRKSKVAAAEAGGITQGIGAYKVLVPVDGKLHPCVFLDTPGHEAFGAMRARGARVTDIVVIVVAADDGIRPQTNEAIAHAKAAGVPIVIAINKIDKDGANPERVMQELSSIGLMPEDWGGDIPMVQISALKGKNIDDLLETVMLVAELQELKANPDRNAKGTVIEAGLHKSKGPVASLIVQNGTLKRGDVVVCGEAFGKVRALFDDSRSRVDEAGPSIPVQVIGLNNVPVAGDEFEVVDSLDVAREKAEASAELLRNERMSAKAGNGKVTLSSLASAVSAGKLSGLDLHQLNIILKVDLQGSIEAVRQALQVLPQDNVTLKFLLEATGDVSTSDVDLAVASKAIIFGFNVKTPGSVKSYAENKGVEIRLYRVIYELVDDVRNAMEGLLEPVEEQVPIGSAEVRAVFSSGSGRVAGCMVTEGKVVNGCGIRVIRNGRTVHVGVLDSLRRVKEIVKEVTRKFLV
ncbi:translation initiation factor IF-2, chloroplastic-like isoform X2 [Hibiscus syriacus]|uniref:translation initiation factor IF-2, chloroplastic-like isoform X2 n=1 Tax=Hibiscus syriacus TaxID=106335 RepID=UPI0019243869|nr:translation initiation factor IF-2, chloroplastic-like isoform X2 [Hibiscus syriacus]